jgi:alpha-amylase
MRVVILATILALALAGTTEEWKQRTIYQLLTDRFARSDGNTSPCTNLHDYCGGDFKGIQDNLDYIANMGFDAIWISPVVTNTPGGYHGYWAKDWFTINSNFGTEQDLKNLVNACHEKGIWVMVDVVANHAGPVGTDFSQITTFPNSSDYHPECSITQ